MKTAFVLSGGASLGAVQVGMLEALAEAGVRPDLLVGTSAGALNAAWLAGHPDPGDLPELEKVWVGMRRERIFPTDPTLVVGGVLGRRNHLFSERGLESMIRDHLGYKRLERASIPVYVVATEILTGREVVLSRGDAVSALMASAALPAVFAPVQFEGRALVDGGVADNTPIRHAIDLGAERIFVLPGGYACALRRPPASVAGMALHALTLVMQHRLAADVERYEKYVDLVVLPAPCPLSVQPIDFSHARELIDRGFELSRSWLRRPRIERGQADLLGFHARHRPPD